MSDALFNQTNAFADRLAAQAASLGQVTTNAQTAVALADYFKPAGAIYETVPRYTPRGANGIPISGQLALLAIGLPAGVIISSITFVGVTGAPAVTPTHLWYGLYDMDRNQLATTDDALTASWPGAPPTLTLPLTMDAVGASSTFTTTYAGLHYLGFLSVAATTPQLQTTIQPVGAELPPALAGDSTAGLTGPTAFPFTAAPITSDAVGVCYAYVS